MSDVSREVVDRIISQGMLVEIETSHAYESFFKRIATWHNAWVKYAYQDADSSKTLAILFEDDYSYDELMDYVVRTVQSYSGCIVCFGLDSLCNASDFVSAIDNKGLEKLPISVLVYDNDLNMNILRQMEIPTNIGVARSSSEQKSYWCWWRDASQYEVATLLELSELYDEEEGDIYTNHVYPIFFEMMIDGKTKKWDGTARVKKYSKSSYKAEKQNYKIPMCQLGFWDADTGHLTVKGKSLLGVVKKYGSESSEFFDCLAKIILIDGKHLDLIKDLDEFQKGCPELMPEKSDEFFVLFDDYMMNKNSMGTRKPSAVKTGAKKAYIRDEPKLWNKLGIVITYGKSRYFKSFQGIQFNWKRINEILLSNAFEEN